MKCNICNLPFDASDLSQVIRHEHLNEKINVPAKVTSKKVISHARDIYPNASIGFCAGVHNYLKGGYDISRMYQESPEFKAGYWQAETDNLSDNFVLQP